jgi:hypothetical protein
MQICPVCAMWVGSNIVDHITAQHDNLFKISFFIFHHRNVFVSFYLLSLFFHFFSLIQLCVSFTGYYSHHKSKYHKHDSYSNRSFSRKRRDGHWQSSSDDGLSPVMSTSQTACDPLLSFLCGAAASNEHENVQLDSSSGGSIEEIHSDDTVLER